MIKLFSIYIYIYIYMKLNRSRYNRSKKKMYRKNNKNRSRRVNIKSVKRTRKLKRKALVGGYGVAGAGRGELGKKIDELELDNLAFKVTLLRRDPRDQLRQDFNRVRQDLIQARAEGLWEHYAKMTPKELEKSLFLPRVYR